MREFGGNESEVRRERAAADSVSKVGSGSVPRNTVRRPATDYQAAPWELVVSNGTNVYLPDPATVPVACTITVAAVKGCYVYVYSGTATVRGVSKFSMGAKSNVTFHNAGDSWV